jgi:isochorismate synthase
MSWEFHGKGGIHPEMLFAAIPDIDLSRIAFGFQYFPETGFADFFACDAESLVELDSPISLMSYIGNSGFVAFPFQPGAKGYLIPPFLDIQECVSRRFVVEGFYRDDEDDSSDVFVFDESDVLYKSLVSAAIESIETGSFEKVVLSRSVRLPFSGKALASFLRRIIERYSSSNFVVFNIPGKGLWVSASPEILIASGHSILGANHSQILAHALAGTKLGNDTSWSEKEIIEQALVAAFIRDKFAEIAGPGQAKEFGPNTFDAGDLRHISTVFHLEGGNAELAVRLAASLHPTPAVCGFPFDSAYGWIVENEELDRSFFTGFSGSFHPERIKFVVNLRTACFRDEQLIFYAGAGITAGSDPDAELSETAAKINVLRQLL